MAGPDGELTVSQRLGRALDRGLLPAGGPAEAAERLIERLERPARVALLGLPGSGKSAILNLLVGTVIVPETLRLPTIIVQHGDVSRMICTLTDGATKIVQGSDLSQVLPLAPALVTLEMDLPALKVINLLEVSAGPMEAEQRRAAAWASKRADIVIWCTTSYLPKEQAVWESLPDSVKDNSFMFLTKVDLLGNRESATAMHERVELRAGEEFRQILSISAKQARAAMPAGGPVDRDMFRDSGANAVIGAIKTRVQSGRRADMDMAELLLARHVEASEIVSRRFADAEEAAPAEEAWTPPPEPPAPEVQKAVAESRPVADEIEAEAAEEAVSQPADAQDVEPAFEETASDGAVATELADDEPEPSTEELVEEEPEATPEPEQVLEADTETPLDLHDAAVPEQVVDAEPERPSEPEPEPEARVAESQPEGVPGLAADADGESGSRKRFSERIKRMPHADEVPAPNLVPRRATWKSKAEADAPPAPPPEQPAPRVQEPRRRSELSPAEPPAARSPASAAPEPEAVAAPKERLPRTPAPDATPATVPPVTPPADAPRAARPQLFGSRRTVVEPPPPAKPEPESNSPDLEDLRETPEPELEPETASEPEPDIARAPEPEPEAVEEPEPEPEPAVEPEPEPETKPVLAARSAFGDRLPRPRPPESPARAPAGEMPRLAMPRVAAPEAAPDPTADAAFSPRAIVMRERRSEPEVAQRRERPRIAARAVAAPAGPTPVSASDQALLDEAIGVIMSRSAELDEAVDPQAKVPVDMILDHSRETTEQVMAVVSRGRSDALRRINGDLGEVLDLIMLMQLEKGHAPADDALTLLLQLRRDLETLRVA